MAIDFITKPLYVLSMVSKRIWMVVSQCGCRISVGECRLLIANITVLESGELQPSVLSYRRQQYTLGRLL